MAETWTLDTLALNDGTAFRIVGEPDLSPPAARPEWATAADSEGAALVREPEHENRTIVLPLEVVPTATKDLALDKLAMIADKLRKAARTEAGIPLVWAPHTSARSVTFDVLQGEITGLPLDMLHVDRNMPRPTLKLVCKPYWRGTETTTSSASAAAPLVTLEIPTVAGDMPALGRLIVTDAATQARRYMEWGLEAPEQYNAAAGLILDSDSLVTAGFGGTGSTRTGAYDPGAAGNSVVRGTLYGAAGATAICGTGNQSHVGAFRVRGRVYLTGAGGAGAYVRFAWQHGDSVFRANPWVLVVTEDAWVDVDLGTIIIPAALVGTQRWQGRVEGMYLPTSSATLDIDYLLLFPQSAGYGKARAVASQQAGSVVGFDDFTGTGSGNPLNARVAPVGGTWATSGSTTDLTFAGDPWSTGEVVNRATISDASPRFGVLGAASALDTRVTAKVAISGYPPNNTFRAGVVARWVDANNYAAAYLTQSSTGSKQFIVNVVVGGSASVYVVAFPQGAPATWYTITLAVFTTGVWQATLAQGTAILKSASSLHTGLATGGALASGKPGLIDTSTSTGVITRYYDEFSAVTQPAEPIVIHSTRTLQVRHDATVRPDSTNTYYGPPAVYRGTRFLVQPGTSRVAVRARRVDIELGADDPVTDNTTIQVAVTPRGLIAPR